MALDNYKTLFEIIQATITIVGIFAAGMWTLYNFGITRFSAPQIEITVKLKSLTTAKGKNVAIFSIDIMNSGRTKVIKKNAFLEIRPLSIRANIPTLARINTPLKYHGEVHEVFTAHDFIEPGEKYHEEIGFIVSEYDYFQIGLLFIGTKRFQIWESNYVFDVSPQVKAAS